MLLDFESIGLPHRHLVLHDSGVEDSFQSASIFPSSGFLKMASLPLKGSLYVTPSFLYGIPFACSQLYSFASTPPTMTTHLHKSFPTVFIQKNTHPQSTFIVSLARLPQDSLTCSSTQQLAWYPLKPAPTILSPSPLCLHNVSLITLAIFSNLYHSKNPFV